jgi:hypothetical protein
VKSDVQGGNKNERKSSKLSQPSKKASADTQNYEAK